MNEPTANILVVDDEAPQMRALCDTLTMEGYVTTGFVSANRALQALRERPYDLLMTDLMMPEMDGIELLKSAREIAPDLVGIMMTGHGTIDTAVKAMQAGALDYIVKPFRLKVVLPVLQRALAVRRLRMANAVLEERIRQRTAELEVANRELQSANRELESFSYSVSHDLRAPVREIEGFCRIFIEDHGATVPAEGIELLEHIVKGSKRMETIIEDLLTFSRLSRQAISWQIVDLDALLRRVLEEQKRKNPGRSIELKLAGLGRCNGDPSLIEQVLINLVANAFKFTRERNPAVIEIGCTEGNGETVRYVRDNGAGFDMQYAHKLFGAFQRLHSAQQFEGTGVGLSIVQRVIDRHGGRIWAESAPQQGATFFFTLPAVPNERAVGDKRAAVAIE